MSLPSPWRMYKFNLHPSTLNFQHSTFNFSTITHMRYLISGGGTGGHIFPAISIANALREQDKDAEILFVGAEGRMEMERVPAAGYPIEALPIQGFDRRRLWRNVAVLIRLVRSLVKARRIIRRFRPDVAIGVGGYASGATMWAAGGMGVPLLVQEQNSFAGVTNRILARRADVFCVAYEGMQRFFPADKIILTGNPVRQDLAKAVRPKADGCKHLLVIGGSLGARTINQAMAAGIDRLREAGVDVVWQCGKFYHETYGPMGAVPFLSDMADQYAKADLVISRAGASSISEICMLGVPAILVPSPNVSEDHQTHNAMALVRKDAAVMVRDVEAVDKLVDTALSLLGDSARLATLGANAKTLGISDSADRIARKAIELAKR